MGIPNCCWHNNQFAFLNGKTYSIFVILYLLDFTFCLIHNTIKEKVFMLVLKEMWGTQHLTHRVLHSEKNVARSATDAFRINTQWQARVATFAKGPSCFLSSSKLYDFLLDLHIYYYESIILLLEMQSDSILIGPSHP